MFFILTRLHYLLALGLDIYSVLLIVYILMSWFPNAYGSKFGQLLSRICEPYLDVFRRIIPPLGMISISGIVALFVLQLAERGLNAIFSLLYQLVLF